jgi:hypothetical protein
MNTKIILGMEMMPERQAIIESSSQDLSDDNRNIASLDKGEAIISSNFVKFATPVKIPLFEFIAKKERKQFDHPIGSFQVIQHYCANMVSDVDGSRFVTYKAAWKVSEGLPATMDVAIAKAWTGEAYGRLEAPEGELGFYLISDGSPHRIATASGRRASST